ncbi:MAG: HAD family phosphatase [Lachnospiraceae bacterium]|nr:HAD family phosphatase [Lachnospiraceae bacterium]
MIKNVVFDIGNVLAKFRYNDYIREIGIPEEKAQRLAAITAESPYWPLMDKGILTKDMTMYNCISLEPSLEPEVRLFFKDMRRLVMEYPDSCEWIRSVKEAGRKVYLLSNYSLENFEMAENEGLFKFLGMEDGRVISYKERLLKPGEEIYKVLFERYGLDPKECVFLDDSARNIETAVRLGMKGIVVKDRSLAKAELTRILEEK